MDDGLNLDPRPGLNPFSIFSGADTAVPDIFADEQPAVVLTKSARGRNAPVDVPSIDPSFSLPNVTKKKPSSKSSKNKNVSAPVLDNAPPPPVVIPPPLPTTTTTTPSSLPPPPPPQVLTSQQQQDDSWEEEEEEEQHHHQGSKAGQPNPLLARLEEDMRRLRERAERAERREEEQRRRGEVLEEQVARWKRKETEEAGELERAMRGIEQRVRDAEERASRAEEEVRRVKQEKEEGGGKSKAEETRAQKRAQKAAQKALKEWEQQAQKAEKHLKGLYESMGKMTTILRSFERVVAVTQEGDEEEQP